MYYPQGEGTFLNELPLTERVIQGYTPPTLKMGIKMRVYCNLKAVTGKSSEKLKSSLVLPPLSLSLKKK